MLPQVSLPGKVSGQLPGGAWVEVVHRGAVSGIFMHPKTTVHG